MSHVRVRVCVPELQRPHAPVSESVWPGVHTPEPPPVQVPQLLHAPHSHVTASHVRERICVPVPHVPQPCEPISVMPAVHEPPPMHDHAPHVQSA
jgi:hypothetical protein